MIKLSSIKKEHTPSKTIYIDLNCNYGDGLKDSKEEQIIEYASSVNIPGSGHSNNPLLMLKALQKAKGLNLSIGAHIGYPHIPGTEEKEMNLSFEEIQALVLYQIGAIKYMSNSQGLEVSYVRPCGALYKQIATDSSVAIAFANAIEKADKWLILVCAAGETLTTVREETKIRIAGEVHLNREYNKEGNLLFDEPLITDKNTIIKKASHLIKENKLITKENTLIDLDFNTIHLENTSNIAVEIAKEVRNMFPENPTSIPITLVGDNALF